jgi:putative ABC transport system ATP-binding protein
MLGCVDAPSSGTLLFDGHDVATLSDAKRSALRLRRIGFIFQRFFLLPMLTAAENVELPLSEAGASKRDRQLRTKELLDYVGLSPRADHRPSQLSGGEMQRVAIARALIIRPLLILADEPTGNLDSRASEEIFSMLRDLSRERGVTTLVMTHEVEATKYADRVLVMNDGRVVTDSADAGPGAPS